MPKNMAAVVAFGMKSLHGTVAQIVQIEAVAIVETDVVEVVAGIAEVVV